MRMSIVEDDPGFVIDTISYQVRLNGELLDAVITADEETGECWVWDRASLQGETYKTKRLTGRVQIERWEAEGIDHPDGTIGFLDTSDGCWTWCSPEHAGYPKAIKEATHIWHQLTRTWINRLNTVLH